MSEISARIARGVHFVKASAAGNDFLLIKEKDAPPDVSEFSRRICDRTSGVGADGVELISPVTDGTADVRARLINSDGSEAEISGNGTRCVAAHWTALHGTPTARVATGAGVKLCTLLERSGALFQFESTMGRATVSDEQTVSVTDELITGRAVDLGNPHFVIFVPSFDFAWQRLAGEVQANAKRFPQGTNVEFVCVRNAHEVEARFFERGAGETRSSGTGSCAAAAAAIAGGKCNSPVTVIAPGGVQQVRLESGELTLRGPAQLICEGEFFI